MEGRRRSGKVIGDKKHKWWQMIQSDNVLRTLAVCDSMAGEISLQIDESCVTIGRRETGLCIESLENRVQQSQHWEQKQTTNYSVPLNPQ